MRGDILDVKYVLKSVMDRPDFSSIILAIVAEKRILIPDCPNPIVTRALTVYTEERLTKLIFPMCELLAYRTSYAPETMVKEGLQQLGIRLTTLEKDERTATMATEVLVRATTDLFWNPYHAGLLQDVELNAGPVSITTEDYAPLLPDANGAFLKSALVVLQLTTYRD